ncbi:unnamed protein product, partial [Ranitomeya imitator]
MANERGSDCVDVNECLRPDVCPDGLCINTVGSFRCQYCDTGFRMNRRGQCEDIDECLVPTTCPYDRCVNNPGSFACVPCPDGYKGSNGRCFDIDECQKTLRCVPTVTVPIWRDRTCARVGQDLNQPLTANSAL